MLSILYAIALRIIKSGGMDTDGLESVILVCLLPDVVFIGMVVSSVLMHYFP